MLWFKKKEFYMEFSEEEKNTMILFNFYIWEYTVYSINGKYLKVQIYWDTSVTYTKEEQHIYYKTKPK